MTFPIFIAFIVVALALGLFVFRAIPGLRAFLAFRGKRVVTCPESHTSEAVEVAAGEAAVGAFLSEPTFHLRECTRWPERGNCGQECMKQIEVDPQNCLVWNMVAKWYEGKSCAYCQKPIAPLHHLDHVPALLGPDQKTTEWKEFRPEQLPVIMETYKPVCWNCHVTETFRRLRPELVTHRPLEMKRVR
jgi:hypothetical protein